MQTIKALIHISEKKNVQIFFKQEKEKKRKKIVFNRTIACITKNFEWGKLYWFQFLETMPLESKRIDSLDHNGENFLLQ